MISIGWTERQATAYKFEPVHTSVGLDELIYTPIGHPFRYHCEVLAGHNYTQKWEKIWMTETFPRHYLPAETLSD